MAEEPITVDADELGQEPTVDADPLLDAAPARGSLEHQCIVSIARRRLFGRSRPPRIGRYTVERRLGTGGMGEVYLAHDEALDRKIAVKRVRSDFASERGQERLRREARALARLSHPNVVQVYEVDEHEGQTFLAMEYVDGQTLGAWLAEQPRSWRRILEIFLAAGQGLAAAHEAGLVHRDFKPDNVLLGRDGSVRVADFGLVLAGEDLRPGREPSGGSSPDARPSVAGRVLGTIRYMPIEQLCGLEVDARSDQFSFCLSLYEALWGEPPFTLTSSLARLSALEAAEPTPPRARPGAGTPGSLWRVIRRGLSRAPDERWPDMRGLLVALQRVAGRRRRLAWVGSASAALILSAGVLVANHEDPVDPCAAVEGELHGVWDQRQRAALRDRVAGLGAEHVADSHERVVAGLDRWSADWVQARTQACRARQELRIDPELALRKGACLTRQRQRVGSLVELLVEPEIDGDAIAGAVDAVAELPPPSACDDELALLGVDPPAVAIAEQVEALRRDVDRAHELRVLGRLDEALTLAEQTEQAAATLGYGPLHAEALAGLARTELAAGSLSRALSQLRDAVDMAELNRHGRLAAELWIELALRTLVELHDAELGAWQLRRARVANELVRAPARARGRLAHARGQLEELRGDAARAEQSYREALTVTEGNAAAAPDRSSYLSALAGLVEERDPSGGEARALYQAALDEARRHYGPHHPFTAQRAFLLASVIEGEDPEGAAALLTRAAEIWTASHARPHRDLAVARMLLAKFALSKGDLEGAELQARELAAIREQTLPEEDREHGQTAQLLMTIFALRGEHEAALEQARIALARWEPVHGLDDPSVMRVYSDMAAALLALGRLDEASDVLEQVLPRVEGRPEEVSVRLHRSELALRRHQLDVAEAELRALETEREGTFGGHELSYALLRALVELRRGELRSASVLRLADARASTPLLSAQIAAWCDQLEMSPAERSALSMN